MNAYMNVVCSCASASLQARLPFQRTENKYPRVSTFFILIYISRHWFLTLPHPLSYLRHQKVQYFARNSSPSSLARNNAYTSNSSTTSSRERHCRGMYLLLISILTCPRPRPKVGIATQLPSGTHSQDNLDYNSYWTFLLNKHDAYESFPSERLNGISCVPAAH